MSRAQRIFFALDDDGDGRVPRSALRDALINSGLEPTDERVAALFDELSSDDELHADAFEGMLGSAGILVERALQGGLAVPDFADLSRHLDEMFDETHKNTSGKQADYIPPLAAAEPEKFGVAVVTIDGQIYSRGDVEQDFSIQSMCKPLNYCFAVEERGAADVHEHVGKEPSGRAFNDRYLMKLLDRQRTAHGEFPEIPFNPMINAGAVMTAALVRSGEPFKDRLQHVRAQWARLMGTGAQGRDGWPRFNKEMARQENFTGFNNLALGYLLRATGKLPEALADLPPDGCADDPDDYEFVIEQAVIDALKMYFATCSLEMNAVQMATVAASLANGGVCPTTQERVLAQSTVRSCLSLMQMCGMYDGSGDFCYTIGLPAKSGVGGGVMLVVPRLMGVCIFSPRLDVQGNSARGVEMAKRLVAQYRLHLYDGVTTGGDRIDPHLPIARWRASLTADALWAAGKGDVRALNRLAEEQVDLRKGDYDLRAPMHLAAAEGHLDALRFLLDHGVDPNEPDRWGGRPLNDARSAGHEEAAALLERYGAKDGEPHHPVADPAGRHVAGADHGDDLAVVELLWAAAEGD
ncbi:MAG: glutaminase, partial [Myxococcales bacterium]|nr:glutaminase [Myxococcales bacterium]